MERTLIYHETDRGEVFALFVPEGRWNLGLEAISAWARNRELDFHFADALAMARQMRRKFRECSIKEPGHGSRIATDVV